VAQRAAPALKPSGGASGTSPARTRYHRHVMADHEKSIEALQHLNAERDARPGTPLPALVDEAARRFDLDAAQSEWLLRTALEGRGPVPSECATCGGALQEAQGVAGHLVCGSGHLVARRER
jgi:hypothetical protein